MDTETSAQYIQATLGAEYPNNSQLMSFLLLVLFLVIYSHKILNEKNVILKDIMILEILSYPV